MFVETNSHITSLQRALQINTQLVQREAIPAPTSPQNAPSLLLSHVLRLSRHQLPRWEQTQPKPAPWLPSRRPTVLAAVCLSWLLSMSLRVPPPGPLFCPQRLHGRQRSRAEILSRVRVSMHAVRLAVSGNPPSGRPSTPPVPRKLDCHHCLCILKNGNGPRYVATRRSQVRSQVRSKQRRRREDKSQSLIAVSVRQGEVLARDWAEPLDRRGPWRALGCVASALSNA